MKVWLVIGWVLSVGTALAGYVCGALPSPSATLYLVLLLLALGVLWVRFFGALFARGARPQRLKIACWLVGTLALLDGSRVAGIAAWNGQFVRQRPDLEQKLAGRTEAYFFQGEFLPEMRHYYVFRASDTPPEFARVRRIAPRWFEVLDR
jgi:hypothetical protein